MTGETSPSTYEIPRALFSTLVVNAFGSFYWLSVLLGLGPWRSFLGAIVLITLAAIGWNMEENPLPFLIAWGGASAFLVVNEISSRRTFVTSSAIVVRSGIFGHHSRSYPLDEVREVTYQYPWFGQTLGVGDLEILGDGWALSLVAIKHPAEQAQRLLDRKNVA